MTAGLPRTRHARFPAGPSRRFPNALRTSRRCLEHGVGERTWVHKHAWRPVKHLVRKPGTLRRALPRRVLSSSISVRRQRRWRCRIRKHPSSNASVSSSAAGARTIASGSAFTWATSLRSPKRKSGWPSFVTSIRVRGLAKRRARNCARAPQPPSSQSNCLRRPPPRMRGRSASRPNFRAAPRRLLHLRTLSFRRCKRHPLRRLRRHQRRPCSCSPCSPQRPRRLRRLRKLALLARPLHLLPTSPRPRARR